MVVLPRNAFLPLWFIFCFERNLLFWNDRAAGNASNALLLCFSLVATICSRLLIGSSVVIGASSILLSMAFDTSWFKLCFLPRRIIPRFQRAAFSLPCFLCFLIILPFLGCQKFLRAALMLDLTRGFLPSADWRGGHLNGLFKQGSELVMSFWVLNLTLNFGLAGLGRDLGGWVTICPGTISSCRLCNHPQASWLVLFSH